MSDLHRNLTRSLAMTGNHLRVVTDDRTLAEQIADNDAELELVRRELEPLERAEVALLKRAIELREMGDE